VLLGAEGWGSIRLDNVSDGTNRRTCHPFKRSSQMPRSRDHCGLHAQHGISDRSELAPRGVPACHDPIAANHHRDWVVTQVECYHGRPSFRSEAADRQSSICPAKVVRPALGAWVEQGDRSTRFRVDTVDLISLVRVAQSTSQPQIRLIVRAAPSQWDQVFDLKWPQDQFLWAKAVSTSILGGFAHSLGNRGWDRMPRHPVT
jgi:hypothetical protein